MLGCVQYELFQSTMYAETRVDRVSIGSLTRGIQAVDLSMRFYGAVPSAAMT